MGLFYSGVSMATGSGGGGGGGAGSVSEAAATDTYHVIAGAGNNAASIKASSGTLFGVSLYNDAPYQLYVKLYDMAGIPNPASDTPKQVFGVQAGVCRDFDVLNDYESGIAIAIVKGIADNDDTPVNAADCTVDVFYADTVGGSTSSLAYRTIAASGLNANTVLGSAGVVTGWAIGNTAAYKIVVQLYDESTVPNPGTDTPAITIPVEASLRSDFTLPEGVSFPSGIGIAITKEDGSAVAAGDCAVNLFYQSGAGENPSLAYRLIAAASTNPNVVKASAGSLFGWAIGNTAGYKVFVELYDEATTPNPGVDTPKLTIPIEASLRSDLELDVGFTSGIGIAITKQDGSAVAAGDCAVNLFYQ